MFAGVMFALLAGLMWGLVFVTPLLLPDYPATLLSCGRYVAFGLVVLPLAWRARRRLADLSRSDWQEALALTLVGNLLYYFLLASAIGHIGAPLATMIIGTLPVVTALSANLLYGKRDGRLPARRLYPALLIIAAGLYLVNRAELAWQPVSVGQQLLGLALASAAVVCWTWYPLRNARWLRAHPHRSAAVWATAQGLVTLPVALIAYLLACLQLSLTAPDFALPFGPTPWRFIGLMTTVGLLCSWVGTLCWNAASQRLPTVLVGPLLVFETLAALLYAFVLRQTLPGSGVLLGVVCLVVGVLAVVSAAPKPARQEKGGNAQLT